MILGGRNDVISLWRSAKGLDATADDNIMDNVVTEDRRVDEEAQGG